MDLCPHPLGPYSTATPTPATKARNAFTPLSSLVSPARKSTDSFYSPRLFSRPGFRLKEISCSTAPFLSQWMKTSCSAYARRQACEMATPSHRRAGAVPRCPALARAGTGTKLLTAAQWAMTLLGIFCLIGAAAAIIATTPEAWPL